MRGINEMRDEKRRGAFWGQGHSLGTQVAWPRNSNRLISDRRRKGDWRGISTNHNGRWRSRRTWVSLLHLRNLTVPQFPPRYSYLTYLMEVPVVIVLELANEETKERRKARKSQDIMIKEVGFQRSAGEEEGKKKDEGGKEVSSRKKT